jgi:hypothetical protein
MPYRRSLSPPEVVDPAGPQMRLTGAAENAARDEAMMREWLLLKPSGRAAGIAPLKALRRPKSPPSTL